MHAADPSCFAPVPAQARHASSEFSCHSDGWKIDNAEISLTASIEPYLLTEELDGMFALHIHQPHRLTIPGHLIFVHKTDSEANVPTFTRASVGSETWKSHLRTRHGAHMPFPTRVIQLRLTRQPLLWTNRFEASIVYRVRFQVCTYIECTAFQRPLRCPCAGVSALARKSAIRPGNKECEVSICLCAAIALTCCLIIKLMDDVELPGCLRTDDASQPLCVELSLSHTIYNDGLDERQILREYCRTAKWGYRENETLRTDSEVICVRGREREILLKTRVGLDVEMSEWFSSCGTHAAVIDFCFEGFIIRYLPDTDLRLCESVAYVSRHVFEQLRDVKETLDTVLSNCMMLKKRWRRYVAVRFWRIRIRATTANLAERRSSRQADWDAQPGRNLSKQEKSRRSRKL